MKLFETTSCPDLPKVDEDLFERIESAERTRSRHRALFDELEAMHCLEVGGEYVDRGPIGREITVAAWNLQRCLYPEQSADLLRAVEPDVVLVSEMDCGMARTHQRNTTRALADSLGMHYAFGLEFLELGLGNEIEARLAADDHNELGWHGNAVLSRVEPKALCLIRLDDHGQWFCPGEGAAFERLGSAATHRWSLCRGRDPADQRRGHLCRFGSSGKQCACRLEAVADRTPDCRR